MWYKLLAGAAYLVLFTGHLITLMILAHLSAGESIGMVMVYCLGYFGFIMLTMHIVYALLPKESKKYWEDP